MLKPLIVAGAMVAATTSVVKVGLREDRVRIGDREVTGPVFQVQEAQGGTLLASQNAVESLGGLVEIQVEGGLVTIEPGVRLTRAPGGFELSSHGRRPLRLASGDGSFVVASPASVVADSGGWRVADGKRLEGTSLRAALAAAAAEPPAGTPPADGSSPPPAGNGNAQQPDIRRVLSYDPFPSAEVTDEQTVKSTSSVSPDGQ